MGIFLMGGPGRAPVVTTRDSAHEERGQNCLHPLTESGFTFLLLEDSTEKMLEGRRGGI